MLLEKAVEGAKSVGAEAELIHLYDLDFKGCISCFACKTLGGKSYGRCAVKDGLAPVLERKGIHRPGGVRVAAVGREDRRSDHERADGARESRHPSEGALPCQRRRPKIDALAIDIEGGTRQRRLPSVDEIGTAGELHGGPTTPMQDSDRVDCPVGWMNARERQPVVPGDLPGNGRDRRRDHYRIRLSDSIRTGAWLRALHRDAADTVR
jgi:hypothetical protein